MAEITRNKAVFVMVPEVEAVVYGVRQRIVALEAQGLTPWRVELGRTMAETAGNPTKLWDLPVEIVPLDDYFRVAYLEWTQDHVPSASCRAAESTE